MVSFVMIIVVIDRLGFELDDRAGSVNLALVFDISGDELELVLDESIVMVNPGLREDGVFSRNSGVLQCYRFRGFKPDFVCLFRSRRVTTIVSCPLWLSVFFSIIAPV